MGAMWNARRGWTATAHGLPRLLRRDPFVSGVQALSNVHVVAAGAVFPAPAEDNGSADLLCGSFQSQNGPSDPCDRFDRPRAP